MTNFHISDILTITDGRLVSRDGMDGIYGILNYMTRDNLFTHQLPRACEQCRPYLIRQYPWLEGDEVRLAVDEVADALSKVAQEDQQRVLLSWIDRLPERLPIASDGMLPVERLPGDDYTAQDPIAELEAMIGKDRIIVMEGPNA